MTRQTIPTYTYGDFAAQEFNEAEGSWAVYDDRAPMGDRLVAIFHGRRAQYDAQHYAEWRDQNRA